jgi:protein O-GlcNAc transferase
MRRLAAIALCVWGLSLVRQRGQAMSDPLPALPAINVADFRPEVRAQVQEAYQVAQQHPASAAAVGKLAMLLDVYERPGPAETCYERAHRLDPASFRWLYDLGSLLARQRRRAAVDVLRAALQLQPGYLPARLKLADALLAAGDLDASAVEYSAIARQFPDAAEAYYGLGRISVARGQIEAAAEYFRKACDLFPSYGAAHYALAQAERQLGRSAEAAQQLALAEKHKTLVPPVNDPLRDELRELDQSAPSHLERGVQLEQAGRLPDAIAEHERALQFDPTLVQAHVNLIALYGRSGQPAKAEEHYRAVLKLNPEQFPKAHYDYGVLLMQNRRYAEAEQAFRRAIQADPSYAEAHNNLGVLLERQGRLAEAASEFQKALQIQPSYRQAHFNLGRIWVNQGRYPEAIGEFQKTLSPVDDQTPAYLYALGATYGRAGNRRKAFYYLEEARREASARRQTGLVASIDADLRSLEHAQP